MPPLPDAILWSLVLVLALAGLLKSADLFVDQAKLLAGALGLPDFLVGATIVALGTSLPELAASLVSVIGGAGEFVAGTVVGSNVANIALIVGVAALGFRGLVVSRELRRRELPFMLGAAILLGLAGLGGRVSRLEGGVLLGLYLLYLAYSVHRQQNGAAVPRVGRLRWLTLLWLGLAAAGVYLGAEFTVRAVVRLTVLAGLGDVSFLALSVVAVGSSLPELSVSWKAAAKGYHDISLGNVVGSNICNTFLVVGLPALIRPLPVSQAVQEVGMPFMLGLSALLVLASRRRRIAPLMGVVMLAAFVAFLLELGRHL